MKTTRSIGWTGALCIASCVVQLGCLVDWSIPKGRDASLPLDDASEPHPESSSKSDSPDAEEDEEEPDSETAQPDAADSTGAGSRQDGEVAKIDGAVLSLDAGLDNALVDSGSTPPISLAGTGQSCTTYSLKSGDMCSGKFCAVMSTQIEMALRKPRIGSCPLVTADDICEGNLSRAVSNCARSEKAKLENSLKPNAELRPLIEACVYENAVAVVDRTTAPAACVGCYLDAAECFLDRCLTQCLTGNSRDCDACRETEGCDDPVASCTGFPDPR